MAIDTERKRRSIVAVGAPYMGPSVLADGSFALGDRQTIAYTYYDIGLDVAIVAYNQVAEIDTPNAFALIQEVPAIILYGQVLEINVAQAFTSFQLLEWEERCPSTGNWINQSAETGDWVNEAIASGNWSIQPVSPIDINRCQN